MFRRPIVWVTVLLLGAVGALCVWQFSRRPATGPASASANPAGASTSARPAVAAIQPAAPNTAAPVVAAATNGIARFRLSNTTEAYGRLLQRNSALVLENACWDTTKPLDLNIPAHLRAEGDPGSYIVKAAGPADAAFQAQLRAAGLRLISYIPHNAWLVRGSQAQVGALTGVAAVVPFEPYFKVRSALLPLAVEQRPIPAGTYLNLLLFADARAGTERELANLGATIVAEGPSPFGPVLTVQARPGDLVSLAQLSGVQIIERSGRRAPVNDLTRVTMNVSADTLVTNNYFGLTGSNVLVAVTDSGIDATHPDLTGRVLPDPNVLAMIPPLNAGVDTIGHGTHVAGIIAGDGAASATVPFTTNGSVAGANYRGKAPASKLFSMLLSVEPIMDLGFDAYIQEQAALTNAAISHNSWGEIGVFDYDLTAASYDAAVRDSLPFQQGSQALTYVFSAGNDGGATNNGLNGVAGSVVSPATAKNVITVGALEQFRNLSNEVVFPPDGVGGTLNITNQPWLGQTDSGSEVASYSSRGNVGPGLEGEFGRYKPDVVAPGTMVVSARSSQWDEGAYYSTTNKITGTFADQEVEPGDLNQYSIFVPPDAIALQITVTPLSPAGLTNLPIYVEQDDPPTTNDVVRGTNIVLIPPALPLVPSSGYLYAIGNPYGSNVTFTIRTEITYTNNLADYYRVLRLLNDGLGGEYRYETGTSMAAPAVSGMLALMHEFYQTRLGRTNSPALMKALLINGARSASAIYNLQVQNTINHQGWGLANLPTSLPPTTNAPAANTSFTFYDQSPTNALATGQSQTRTLTLTGAAQSRPLRVTLVWTDPPGNPVAGVKLVNDLDLVVTNLDTGEVYLGNNIPANSDFTAVSDTNAPPAADVINNVENVYISQPLGTNFTVTVKGTRVNVNAVTAHTNDVVQDYALVISSGNGEVTSSFSVTAEGPVVSAYAPLVTGITNATEAVPLLNQSVGANAPLVSGPHGVTNQWHFYVLTNNGATADFTNAAFITFLPPTLATPRMGTRDFKVFEHSRPEADIDMYVSKNSALTNLDPAVLNDTNTLRSVGRGGTETIVLSNAMQNEIYYVGVKSEDQMGGQYGFFGVFSDEPFASKDEFGNLYLRGFPLGPIPEGPPSRPGARLVFAIAPEQIKVRRVLVTNQVSHANFGDLFSNLSHNNSFAVLHNHTFGNGDFRQLFAYDDSLQGDNPGSKKADGPGSLNNFIGQEGVGQWMLTLLDNVPNEATGAVEQLTIKLEPQRLEEEGDTLVIGAGGWGYTFIEVPPGATNLTIGLVGNTLPVDLYVRRGDLPDFDNYDKKKTVTPPGSTNELSITKLDLPPLQAGIYYIGVFNPNAVSQTVTITARIELDLNGIVPIVFGMSNAVPLLDDAVTTNSLFVTNNQKVITAEVGVRINHPRISDLALQLESPTGRRVLLFENRGGATANALGSDVAVTNTFNFASTGGPAETNLVVDTGMNSGVIRITYDFYNVPDTLSVYYDGAPLTNTQGTVLTNLLLANAGYMDIPYGPGASTMINFIINQGGNTNTTSLWNLSATTRPVGFLHAIFTEDTNRVAIPGSLLKFAVPPFNGAGGGSGTTLNTVLFTGYEPAAVGSYVAPTVGVPDGWDVLTNSVTVITNAPHTGVNALALQLGAISRTLPTTAGLNYVLSYAYRSGNLNPTHWWPGDNSTVDIVAGDNGTLVGGTAYTSPAEVGAAFNFDGVDDYMEVNSTFPFHTAVEATFEFWLNTPANQFPYETVFWTRTTATPDNNRFNFYINTNCSFFMDYRSPAGALHAIINDIPIPRNAWTHLAITKVGDNYSLYTNGVLAVTAADPLAPDLPTSVGWRFSGQMTGTHEYEGSLDEVATFDRALSAGEIYSIYLAGAAGKCGTPAPPSVCAPASVQVDLAGFAPNVLSVSNSGWQVATVPFTATTTGTALQFSGLASGVVLDSIQLQESVPGTNVVSSTNGYFLPEEPLTELKGDEALGNWKLEIWDSRVGATNPVPELLGWNLSFLFEQTLPPFILVQPFTTVTSTVAPGSFEYLIVDVPSWATVASNYLLSATQPVFVWFNQNGAPTGTGAGDLEFPMFTAGPGTQITTGVGVLVTNGTPPLLPGQRYYIGIQNTNATPTTYSFRVDFDITALTNGVPYTAVTSSNSTIRYFSYDVSAAASAVQFDLVSTNGDVNLIARQGAPLPTVMPANYQFGSFNIGTNAEQILVFTNGAPVALTPGLWFLGVVSTTPTPVDYTITATELTNAFPTIITLTNGIPYMNTNSGAAGTAQYYRYVVTTNAARVQFETFAAEGDFTLVAHKGLPLPDLTTYDYRSANGGTSDELIVITTNSAPVTLTFGDWFITAVKISGGTAGYTIMATEWNVTGQPIVPVVTFPGGGDFCFTWNSLPGAHYLVQSTPSLSPPVWTDVTNLTAVDFTTTYCTPMTGTMQFFRVVEGVATTAAATTSVNFSSVQFTPGGVVMNWFGPIGATFHVEWTDVLFPPTWTQVPTVFTTTDGSFTFTDDGSQTAPLGPARFYRLVQP